MKILCWIVLDALLLAWVLTGCGGLGPARVDPDAGKGGPALLTSQVKLDSALRCPASFSGAHDPVLLVHGTAATGSTWNSGYVRQLGVLGYDVCTVTLPAYAWNDIQRSAEYVVNAVRSMSARSGRRVAMIGHSQGALEMRWAIKWWPDVRASVSNYISLAGVNHGVPLATQKCASGRCPAAAWQMISASKFLGALNRDAETPGDLPYTDIYSETDTVVIPPTSLLNGATNIAVQQLCPDRQVSHPDMIYDAAVFALVLDALSHQASADLQRVDPASCRQRYLPGLKASQAWQDERVGLVRSLVSYFFSPTVTLEPKLMLYASGPRDGLQ